MKQAILILSCIALLSGCGLPGQGKRDAIAHFNRNRVAIEAFVDCYRTNSAITYVEFKADRNVDLRVLHLDPSFRDDIGSPFKHRLFGVSVDSPSVSNALAYASCSEGALRLLRDHADSAGCISISKAVSDSYPWDIEVGYARSRMSKYIYRRFKDSVDVTSVVSRPPWRDDCLAQLSSNWVLVIGRPAFN